MSDQVKQYTDLQKDLMNQIAHCNKNKLLVQETLRQLYNQYQSGLLDPITYKQQVETFLQGKTPSYWYKLYDEHIAKCHKGLAFSAEKLSAVSMEEPKTSALSLTVISLVALIIFAMVVIVMQPNITGLFIFDGKENVVFEDGYTTEGTKWVDIKGSRLYERCLQVESKAEFTSVNILAKVTSAISRDDLELSLYGDLENTPDKKLGACTVKNYNDVWKSCAVKELQQGPGKYWICAGSPGGEREQTYYTIAYSIGDTRKTALWTGQNWQKLDKSSYTMKGQFMSHA